MLSLFRGRNTAITTVNDNVLALPDFNKPVRGGYDRRATGISVDFVYKPESYARECAASGYGDAVSFKEVFNHLGQYPSESFLGVTLVGADAGRHLAGRLVNHFENYGFGHGFCFDVTKVIAVIPLTDAMGCGACPGDTVVISPSGWGADLDTLYHEYLHNVGYEALHNRGMN